METYLVWILGAIPFLLAGILRYLSNHAYSNSQQFEHDLEIEVLTVLQSCGASLQQQDFMPMDSYEQKEYLLKMQTALQIKIETLLENAIVFYQKMLDYKFLSVTENWKNFKSINEVIQKNKRDPELLHFTPIDFSGYIVALQQQEASEESALLCKQLEVFQIESEKLVQSLDAFENLQHVYATKIQGEKGKIASYLQNTGAPYA